MHLSLLSLLPLLAHLTSISATPIPSPDPAPAAAATAADIASALHHHLIRDSTLAARGPLTHTGVKIVSNKSGKCLSVAYQSRYPNNGDQITLVDCKSTKLWDIYQDGSVVMHDFNNMPDVASGYALDAGSSPSNEVRLKVCLMARVEAVVCCLQLQSCLAVWCSCGRGIMLTYRCGPAIRAFTSRRQSLILTRPPGP
jgi:hypothetical protein